MLRDWIVDGDWVRWCRHIVCAMHVQGRLDDVFPMNYIKRGFGGVVGGVVVVEFIVVVVDFVACIVGVGALVGRCCLVSCCCC